MEHVSVTVIYNYLITRMSVTFYKLNNIKCTLQVPEALFSIIVPSFRLLRLWERPWTVLFSFWESGGSIWLDATHGGLQNTVGIHQYIEYIEYISLKYLRLILPISYLHNWIVNYILCCYYIGLCLKINCNLYIELC